MAVDPSGQTIPSGYFYERGYSAGYNAASAGQSRTLVDQAMQSMPEFQDPRYQATAADKSSFKSGFTAGYDKVYAAKKTDYGDSYTKTVAEAEKTVSQQKTVEQWENETNIPSWGIAKSVSANFGVDVENFESKVASKPVAASAAGLAFGAKMVSFHNTARSVVQAVQAQGYPSPSAAVAEIRKGRTALNALMKEYQSLSGAVPVRTQAGPTTQTSDAKIEPPVAKAPFPVWAILAALGVVGVGGYFMFFYEKKDKKKPVGALPPPKAPMMEPEEFVSIER